MVVAEARRYPLERCHGHDRDHERVYHPTSWRITTRSMIGFKEIADEGIMYGIMTGDMKVYHYINMVARTYTAVYYKPVEYNP